MFLSDCQIYFPGFWYSQGLASYYKDQHFMIVFIVRTSLTDFQSGHLQYPSMKAPHLKLLLL
jgi:hypothetical protein